MSYAETPLTMECQGDTLVGILTQPETPAPLGVLIIVGGPQCRTGSHRQFTLLARGLAQQDIPSLRFDYRGMGDSTGTLRNFEEIQEDITSALQGFLTHSPTTRRIVLWGLCDAASAAIFHTRLNPEIAGLILCNPWTRTEQSLAKAQIKHYYRSRLTNPQLWKKIFSGQLKLTQSLRELCSAVLKTTRSSPTQDSLLPLPERMQQALADYTGPTLLILSGQDLTAREFEDTVKTSDLWKSWLSSPVVTRHDLPEADHTFSQRHWNNQVIQHSAEWVNSLVHKEFS
ncbi:MAG: hydrolase 1, exosortase A system-associated [Ferrovum myxofaciens]|uniref:hydrolase 1, exosortase A system-associated n=1 Tax=Ferrovum myxofaciens TaxID=416213 RepID=UPI00235580C6|nr:hydrolase 1, exosortase A system-associated [Ferrovum myxofaciens]QKE41674.1 MAG: hydrolase 1, exosortase A system-associated [Ferrovum myxofaciens]